MSSMGNEVNINGGVNEVEQLGCNADLVKTVVKAFESKDTQLSELIALVRKKDEQIDRLLTIIENRK